MVLFVGGVVSTGAGDFFSTSGAIGCSGAFGARVGAAGGNGAGGGVGAGAVGAVVEPVSEAFLRTSGVTGGTGSEGDNITGESGAGAGVVSTAFFKDSGVTGSEGGMTAGAGDVGGVITGAIAGASSVAFLRASGVTGAGSREGMAIGGSGAGSGFKASDLDVDVASSAFFSAGVFCSSVSVLSLDSGVAGMTEVIDEVVAAKGYGTISPLFGSSAMDWADANKHAITTANPISRL